MAAAFAAAAAHVPVVKPLRSLLILIVNLHFNIQTPHE
jgi:hypothetical protein